MQKARRTSRRALKLLSRAADPRSLGSAYLLAGAADAAIADVAGAADSAADAGADVSGAAAADVSGAADSAAGAGFLQAARPKAATALSASARVRDFFI